MRNRWLRWIALAVPLLLLPTTLLPLASLGLGTALPGAGTDPAELVRAGADAPLSAQTDVNVSIAPPSSDLEAGASLALQAEVTRVDPAYNITIESYHWSLSNASGGASLSPAYEARTTLSTLSTTPASRLQVELTVTGWIDDLYFTPFSDGATAVFAVLAPLSLGPLNATPDPATPQEEVHLSVPISGGAAPYQLQWSFGDGTRAETTSSGTGTAEISHLFPAGTFLPSVTVTDGVGQNSTTSSSSSVVVGEALRASVSGPPGGDVGAPQVFHASVAGGTPPYSYLWTDSEGASTPGNSSFSIVPAQPGVLGVSLEVTDSAGNQFLAPTFDVQVRPSPALTLRSSLPAVDLGEALPELISIQGGTPPYSVSWQPSSQAPELTGTFAAPGNYSEPFTPSSPGEVTAVANGEDAAGEAFGSVSIVGRVLPDPTASVTGPAGPLVSGEPFTLDALLSGGVAPYSWSWQFTRPVSALSPTEGSSTAAGLVSFQGESRGTGTLEALFEATDAQGFNFSATLGLSEVPPLSASFLLPLPPTEQGVPLALSLEVTGGTPPYTAELVGSDGSSVSASLPGPGFFPLLWTPRGAGPVELRTTVEDTAGRTAYANASLVVASPPSLSLTLPRDPTDVGPYPLTVVVSGGAPPFSGFLNASSGPSLPISGSGPSFPLELLWSAPGEVYLRVELTDALGGRAYTQQSLAVYPRPTPALVLSSDRLDVGEPFEASLSVSGGTGSWLSSQVSFGDGTGSQSAPAEHSYSAPGSYLVTGTVEDSAGAWANATPETVEVNADPTVASGLRQPGVDAGLAASFSSQVSFGTPPYSYQWGFGDGSGSSEANPTHIFSSPGLYEVSLTVTDSAGVTVAAPTLNVSVESPPQLWIGANATYEEVGQPLTLSAQLIGGALPESVLWSLPGGRSAGGTQVGWIPASPGEVEVRASLKDAAGDYAFAELNLTVAPALSLGPVLLPSPVLESGRSWALLANVAGGAGGLTYLWNVGGQQFQGLGLSSLSYVPGTPGETNGSLSVTDELGARVSAAFTFRVVGPPSLTLSSPQARLDAGEEATVVATVQGGFGNLSYRWSLPPGASGLGSGAVASLTFPAAGDYPVGVTVLDALGGQASALLVLSVSSALTVSLPAGAPADTGLAIPIVPSIEGGTGPFQLDWTLPPGASQSGNDTFTFATPGTFSVEVEVHDATGATASARENLSVMPAPSVSFPVLPLKAAAGVPTPFEALLEGGTSPWNADFEVSGTESFPGEFANVTFPDPGTYPMLFVATDLAGARLVRSWNVSVLADPLELAGNVSEPAGIVPFAPVVQGVWSGGVGPFEGRIEWNGTFLSGWEPLGTTGPWNVSVPLSSPGPVRIALWVEDSLGAVAERSFQLEGLASPPDPVLSAPTGEAGLPVTVSAEWPGPWIAPGERLSEHWWGPGLSASAGPSATFLENASGVYSLSFSVVLLDESGAALENLTFRALLRVEPGPPVALVPAGDPSAGYAGENLSLLFASVDSWGNVNTSAGGNVTLTPSGAGSAGVGDLSGGYVRFPVSSTSAGNVSYAVSAPGLQGTSVAILWTADAMRGTIRVLSWSREGSSLWLNLSVVDVFGNPLSGYPVEVSAPGLPTVGGTAEGGTLSLLLPGAASVGEVTLTGQHGASTTLELPGPATPEGGWVENALLALFLGGVLGAALFFRVRSWRRRRRPPEDRTPDPLLEAVEESPGEEVGALGEIARLRGWSGNDVEGGLSALERAGQVHREPDGAGGTRYYPGPAPTPGEPATTDPPASGEEARTEAEHA